MTSSAAQAMFATLPDAIALNSVRLLERRRIEATRANDVAALEPLLHDQLMYVNSAAQIYDKQRYLQGIASHELSYDRDFDVRETHARALDNLVILAGVMLGHSRLDGEQQVFHFPCIGVWRRDSGKWRMIAWQSSSGAPGSESLRRDPHSSRS